MPQNLHHLKATCAVVHFPWTSLGQLDAASPLCGGPRRAWCRLVNRARNPTPQKINKPSSARPWPGNPMQRPQLEFRLSAGSQASKVSGEENSTQGRGQERRVLKTFLTHVHIAQLSYRLLSSPSPWRHMMRRQLVLSAWNHLLCQVLE